MGASGCSRKRGAQEARDGLEQAQPFFVRRKRCAHDDVARPRRRSAKSIVLPSTA
jgi:hypothetical protein